MGSYRQVFTKHKQFEWLVSIADEPSMRHTDKNMHKKAPAEKRGLENKAIQMKLELFA